MGTDDDIQNKYFSFFKPEDVPSEKDMEILDTDSPNEKKIKKFLKEKLFSSTKQNETGIPKPEDIDDELVGQFISLFTDSIESGEMDKNDILEALSYGITEMMDFMHHEPDHNISLSTQEKEALHKKMINTIQTTGGSDEHSALCESAFPELVKHLELMMAKVRTPRF